LALYWRRPALQHAGHGSLGPEQAVREKAEIYNDMVVSRPTEAVSFQRYT